MATEQANRTGKGRKEGEEAPPAGSGPDAPPAAPEPAPAASTGGSIEDENHVETMGGITIGKVRGKDQFMIFDATEEQVGIIRKRPVDTEWTVRLFEHMSPSMSFTSAISARCYVFGYFAGIEDGRTIGLRAKNAEE